MKTQKTILVIDDFEVNTFAVGVTLSNAGYNVLKATEAQEAIKLFKGTRVDLVITDYKMPKMNGVQLIKELKKTSGISRLPFIVLSSEKDEAKKQEAYNAGVTMWIEKPFQINTFLKVIAKALK